MWLMCLLKVMLILKKKNNESRTALHRAAEYGHESVLQILIENGANPHEKDSLNLTAAQLAVSKKKPQVGEFLDKLVIESERNLRKLPRLVKQLEKQIEAQSRRIEELEERLKQL